MTKPPAAEIAAPSKRVASKAVRIHGLATILDHVRYAVSRLREAGVVFAHGTNDATAEAIFIVCESLHLAPDQFEPFATANVTSEESRRILKLVEQRITTRKPAAYLLNKIYMRGLPFFVDERTIVPRSFIGELLDSHFVSEDASLIEDPGAMTQVLDLCTGSGCLAILAAYAFPNAQVDAVELSKNALAVAGRNVRDHGLDHRITLYRGDLYEPVDGTRYDLIISNPPYVDAEGMAGLPPECRHEPAMAFDGGADGLDLVRRIIDEASAHLAPGGGLLCEIGRGRANVEATYPDLPFIWLDTEDSEGEVFFIAASDLAGVAGERSDAE
jgi:ribosomal protein L3 glutamine methyltransferase